MLQHETSDHPTVLPCTSVHAITHRNCLPLQRLQRANVGARFLCKTRYQVLTKGELEDNVDFAGRINEGSPEYRRVRVIIRESLFVDVGGDQLPSRVRCVWQLDAGERTLG